jgi:hypothetical protein
MKIKAAVEASIGFPFNSTSFQCLSVIPVASVEAEVLEVI